MAIINELRVDPIKIKNTYDYYKGRRHDKLGTLRDATDQEIRDNEVLNSLFNEFDKVNIPLSIQTDGSQYQVSFNATKVPTTLADEFLPNGKYSKYVNNYNSGSKEVQLIVGESVMNPTPVPYKYEPIKLDIRDDFEDEVDDTTEIETESKGNPFKSHFICQGCGKPLSQCTCDIEDEDKVNESLTESESLSNSITVKMSRDDFDRMCRENSILQGLSRSDYIEIRDLFNIGYKNFDVAVNDLWHSDDDYHEREWYSNLLKKYTNSFEDDFYEENFSSSSATQSSSVGSYKRGIIDLIGNVDEEDNEEVLQLKL